MEIQELNKQLIDRANQNSMNGTRGDLSAQSYKSYIDEVLSWNISNSKKQKILEQVHKRYSKILEYEAQHVSVLVAGPAKYNSRRLDKSDQILQKSQEFYNWFNDLKEQVKNSKKESKETKTKHIVNEIGNHIKLNLDPTKDIMSLANIDNKKFIELYERYNPIFKWRKNSNIYKLYQASLAGEIKEIRKEVIYEDENFTAYIEGDRAYIRFVMKIQRQLIVALKSRKWWWNSNKKAWSTYLDRVDKEWIKNISERYEKYI